MDADETMQLLGDLPADLLELGWQLAVSESAVRKWQTPSYTAVYIRPFDDRLDAGTTSAEYAGTYDRRTRQQIVRVSTLKDCSPSWPDARQDAIRRMREADAKRRKMMWHDDTCSADLRNGSGRVQETTPH